MSRRLEQAAHHQQHRRDHGHDVGGLLAFEVLVLGRHRELLYAYEQAVVADGVRYDVLRGQVLAQPPLRHDRVAQVVERPEQEHDRGHEVDVYKRQPYHGCGYN